jgi:hypothetical protein
MGSRRQFIQQLSAPLLVLPFLPRNRTAGTPTLNNAAEGPVLRVAIMGLGGYGTRVAEAMQGCKRAKLVGVISGTPSKIKDWQSKYGIPDKNCYNYDNFDRIRENKDIDAVYVITPNAQHHGQVLRVAKAGKHVICEKPMAVNAKEGKEMVEACKKQTSNCWWATACILNQRRWRLSACARQGNLERSCFFKGSAALP